MEETAQQEFTLLKARIKALEKEVARLNSDHHPRLWLLEAIEARRLAMEAGEAPRKDRAYFNDLRDELLRLMNSKRGQIATENELIAAVDWLTEAATSTWQNLEARPARKANAVAPQPRSPLRR